jgi:hypothetical protein
MPENWISIPNTENNNNPGLIPCRVAAIFSR